MAVTTTAKKPEPARVQEPPVKICKNCAHFHEGYRVGENMGVCRRFPPTVNGPNRLASFPVVLHGDSCGEYT